MAEYTPSNNLRSLGPDSFAAENARELRVGKRPSFAQTPRGEFINVIALNDVDNSLEFDLDGVYRELTGMAALGQDAEILIPSNTAFALLPGSGEDGYFSARFRVWWGIQLQILKNKLGTRYEGLDFHIVYIGENGQPLSNEEMENEIPCVAIKFI